MGGTSRRAVLKALGVVGVGSGLAYGGFTLTSSSTGTAEKTNEPLTTTTTPTRTETPTKTETPTPEPATWRLEPLAHSTFSSSVGGFAEGSIRADGRYAAVGTRFAGTGSYLVDLRDPHSPKLVHHLPAGDGAVTCLDVKFGPRTGLYCRTNRPTGGTGVEIVDYGFAEGTPRSPTVIGTLDTGSTHNHFVHDDASLVYAVNYTVDPDSGGFDVWDVSNPRSPRKIGEGGPSGQLHDVVYDPVRQLLHCAYMGEAVNGYVILDASDPRNPTEIGRFDYGKHTSYTESEVGEEAFGNCHYAIADPRRDLAIVGDERSYGVPGGKHVFDIGWRDGSLENPIPVGFTVSPNAQLMNSDGEAPDDGELDETERFDWTGHNFDIIPLEDATLLTSGDWHEGTVLYDITDPTNPHPIDVHKTDENPVPQPSEQLQAFGGPPMAYSSEYNTNRGFALTSDLYTGIYTYDIEGIIGTTTDTKAESEKSSESSR
jgi:hypothetical protein